MCISSPPAYDNSTCINSTFATRCVGNAHASASTACCLLPMRTSPSAMGAVDLQLTVMLLILPPDSSKKPKYFPTKGDAQMLLNLNLTSTPPGCTTALHLTNARSVFTQSMAASM